MKVTVAVEQQDIVEGLPFEASSCPVALALLRQFPNTDFVLVEPESITLCWHTVAYDYEESFATPRCVERFVIQFDSNKYKYVKPFKFTLDVSKAALKSGLKPSKPARRAKRKTS